MNINETNRKESLDEDAEILHVGKSDKQDLEENSSLYMNYLYNNYSKRHIGELKEYYYLKNKFSMNRYNINKSKSKLKKMHTQIKLINTRKTLSDTDKKVASKRDGLIRRIKKINKRLSLKEDLFNESDTELIFTKKGKKISDVKRVPKRNIHDVLNEMKEDISRKEKEIFLNKYDFLYDYKTVDDPSTTFESQILDYEKSLKNQSVVRMILEKKKTEYTNLLNELDIQCNQVRLMLKTEKEPSQRKILFESYGKLLKEKYMLKKRNEIENVIEI
jgi:hypothetical protein